MSQDEEQLHPNVQIAPAAADNSSAEVSVTPSRRPFKLTMEFPLFIAIMTASLSGKLNRNIVRSIILSSNYEY